MAYASAVAYSALTSWQTGFGWVRAASCRAQSARSSALVYAEDAQRRDAHQRAVRFTLIIVPAAEGIADGDPAIERAGFVPVYVRVAHGIGIVRAVLDKRTREQQRHLRIVRGLARNGVVRAAVGEFAHTAGVPRGDRIRSLKFHEAAQRVARKLAEEAPLGAGVHAGVDRAPAGARPAQRVRPVHGRLVPNRGPVASEYMFYVRSRTAEHPGRGPADAVGVVAHGDAVPAEQVAAHAQQKGVPAREIPGARAVEGHARDAIARGGQRKPVRDARHGPVAHGGDARGVGFGALVGALRDQNNAIAGRRRRPVRVGRRAIAQQRPALGPGEQIAAVVGTIVGVDHAQHRFAPDQKRDGRGRAPEPLHVGGGAVIGVDDPEAARVAGGAARVRQFFAEKAVLRKGAAERFPDGPFGGAVGVSVLGSACGAAGLVERLAQDGSGSLRGGDGDLKFMGKGTIRVHGAVDTPWLLRGSVRRLQTRRILACPAGRG